MKPSITFIVPAYNEEKSLSSSVEYIFEAATPLPLDFEVVIVNDASRDKTADVAIRLADKYPRVRVIHNPVNLGFGGSYKRGIGEVRTEYLLLVPGDNDFMPSELRKILAEIGNADFVEHYPENPEVRPLERRILSWLFRNAMNFLFGLHLPYYTGITIYKKSHLEKIPFHTRDFTFNAQILVKGIKLGHTFLPVGVNNTPRKFGKSSILKPKNLASCVWSMMELWIQVIFFKSSIRKAVLPKEEGVCD